MAFEHTGAAARRCLLEVDPEARAREVEIEVRSCVVFIADYLVGVEHITDADGHETEIAADVGVDV